MSDQERVALKFTGERFVPGEAGAQIAYEHLHRYFFARRFAEQKAVLDLGCGEGYGANLMAKVARSVVAIDISPEAIAHAQSCYTRDNLRFLTADCRKTALPQHSFDLIVCFEMMEHIAEHEQLLAEVKRLLNPEGMWIVSSPDKRYYSDASGYENPFHVKELYLEEFQAILSRFFPHVEIFLQKTCLGSVLWRNTGSPGTLDERSEFIEVKGISDRFLERQIDVTEEAKYAVGVCSSVPLDAKIISLRSSVWNDLNGTILRELEEEKATLQGLLDRSRIEIEKLQSRILIQEQQISLQGQGIQQRDSEIGHLIGTLRSQEALLTEREKLLQGCDLNIRGLEQTVKVLRDFEEQVKDSIAWKIYRALVRPIRHLIRGLDSPSQ